MKPLSFMLIAGEASGDLLAAELVNALREKIIARTRDGSADVQPLQTALAPRYFGAGGLKMAEAGVDLAIDLTQHSVIGISDVLKNFGKFRRIFRHLFQLAIERQPDVIVGIDYGGFNLRFAKAIKNYVRNHRSEFTPWNPRIVQFVSPQVWASRPGRAYTIAATHDLLLCIFPFEKAWYRQRVPGLRVEFVGHPMIGRSPRSKVQGPRSDASSTVVLLPGSRRDEVRRHLPVVYRAARQIVQASAAKFICVLPNESLVELARSIAAQAGWPDLTFQNGSTAEALATADVAITKSGTITMECATAGVPAAVFYKTSWLTYLIAKQIVSVKYLAMPNLLAGEEIYPEFIQHAATAENIASAVLDLLRNETRRAAVKARLAQVTQSLGGPGAADRAAEAILSLRP